jgi:hypothetical protein
MTDSLTEATARLEVAVERLASAAGRARPAGVPPEELAELSRRLDATLVRLKAALREDGDLPDDEAGP